MSINTNNFGQNINTIVNTNVILQTLKRRAPKSSTPLDKVVTLEKVLGFTITSNLKLAQSHDGTIAYLAGCVIVLYDTRSFKQDFILSQARKTLTTLCFSADGRILATGESGHDPKLRIFDVKEKIQLAEFPGHKYSIDCVCFSPNVNSNLIISIGSVHDMGVNVWNYKTKFKVASNKIACKVKGIAFSYDGTYFVTVGNRHVKFWYLSTSTLMETVPLKGRAAILSDMKNSHFCDVVCGFSSCSQLTFAITTSGVLCEFDENRSLRKVIELRVDRAYCIFADSNSIYIGCSSGTILIFRQNNLEFIASLPRPHNLGVDISKGFDTSYLLESLNNFDLKYPDCIALCFNPLDSYLCAIYNDHSLYIWEIKELDKVKKVDSHLFHSSCCWGLDTFSNQISNSNESFITCSSDNTLRIWSLENLKNEILDVKPNNIFSKDLMNIIYIDNDYSALCDTEFNINNAHQQDCSENVPSSNIAVNSVPQALNSDQSNIAPLNSIKLGARCIKISPFGCHLATGDRNGNIRVYDLKHLESIILIEAHESEILYLQYSQPESGRLLLASSSRDRLIHIFDAKKNYELIQTLDDHSAAITATRFCYNQIEKQFYLISCGSDKSIIFRCANEIPNLQHNAIPDNMIRNNNFFEVNNQNSSKIQFTRSSYVCEKTTFYDMVIDPTKNFINTVSQDRFIRTYSIKDGKKLRQFKGSLNEDGYLMKMDIDRSGSLLATSCTDKCVYIWDLNSCECLAYLYGHSELIIDLKFTYDNKYLITVGVDSCVLVWNLNALNSSHNSAQKKHSTNANYLFTAKDSIDELNLDFLIDPNILSHDNSDFESIKSKSKLNLLTSESANYAVNEISLNDSKRNNVRRSRAVWGPICNTSFAIMIDNDTEDITNEERTLKKLEDKKKNYESSDTNYPSPDLLNNNTSLTLEGGLPLVQFPSPNVEKNFYKVVNVDNVHSNKSLCLTIEDVKDDDPKEVPCTPIKEYSSTELDDILHDKQISPNDLDTDMKYLNLSNCDSANQRRQSLSAKYLSKSQKANEYDHVNFENLNQKVESPATSIQLSNTGNNINNKSQSFPFPISLANTTYSSAHIAAESLKFKKNKTSSYLQVTALHAQHTESSLNKIKQKQSLHVENSVPKFAKSPSMSSFIENSGEAENNNLNSNINNESGTGRDFTLHDSSIKLDTIPSLVAMENNEKNLTSDSGENITNLKKASSMVSLNSPTVPCQITSSSSFHTRPITSNFVNKSSVTTKINLMNNQLISNLPPKTVRQVKQKSSDKYQNIPHNLEKNSNLERTQVKKLSNSIQNLQTVILPNSTDILQNKKPQRYSTYGRNSRKQRSNTEELMPLKKYENNDHNNDATSTFKTKESNELKFEIGNTEKKHAISPKMDMKLSSDEEILWNEFKENLALLDFINKKARFENLNQTQKQQQKELLAIFNKSIKSFILQIETISEKNHKN